MNDQITECYRHGYRVKRDEGFRCDPVGSRMEIVRTVENRLSEPEKMLSKAFSTPAIESGLCQRLVAIVAPIRNFAALAVVTAVCAFAMPYVGRYGLSYILPMMKDNSVSFYCSLTGCAMGLVVAIGRFNDTLVPILDRWFWGEAAKLDRCEQQLDAAEAFNTSHRRALTYMEQQGNPNTALEKFAKKKLSNMLQQKKALMLLEEELR